jgi:hypothetical protein
MERTLHKTLLLAFNINRKTKAVDQYNAVIAKTAALVDWTHADVSRYIQPPPLPVSDIEYTDALDTDSKYIQPLPLPVSNIEYTDASDTDLSYADTPKTDMSDSDVDSDTSDGDTLHADTSGTLRADTSGTLRADTSGTLRADTSGTLRADTLGTKMDTLGSDTGTSELPVAVSGAVGAEITETSNAEDESVTSSSSANVGEEKDAISGITNGDESIGGHSHSTTWGDDGTVLTNSSQEDDDDPGLIGVYVKLLKGYGAIIPDNIKINAHTDIPTLLQQIVNATFTGYADAMKSAMVAELITQYEKFLKGGNMKEVVDTVINYFQPTPHTGDTDEDEDTEDEHEQFTPAPGPNPITEFENLLTSIGANVGTERYSSIDDLIENTLKASFPDIDATNFSDKTNVLHRAYTAWTNGNPTEGSELATSVFQRSALAAPPQADDDDEEFHDAQEYPAAPTSAAPGSTIAATESVPQFPPEPTDVEGAEPAGADVAVYPAPPEYDIEDDPEINKEFVNLLGITDDQFEKNRRGIEWKPAPTPDAAPVIAPATNSYWDRIKGAASSLASIPGAVLQPIMRFAVQRGLGALNIGARLIGFRVKEPTAVNIAIDTAYVHFIEMKLIQLQLNELTNQITNERNTEIKKELTENKNQLESQLFELRIKLDDSVQIAKNIIKPPTVAPVPTSRPPSGKKKGKGKESKRKIYDIM